MQYQKSVQTRFIDWWSYVAWGGTGFVLFISLIAVIWRRPLLLNQTVQVTENQPAQLTPVQLVPHTIGALRIGAIARLAPNEVATFEVRLLDAQGRIIAVGGKEVWSTSGSWSEEGESGLWHETDLQAELDIRAKQNELVTVQIALLDYTNTTGQDLNKPLSIRVSVEDGMIDTRYLTPGFWGCLILGLLSWVVVPVLGKRIISGSQGSNELTQRATLGGPDRLLRIIIKVKCDDTTGSTVRVILKINTADGAQIYEDKSSIMLIKFTNPGKPPTWGGLTKFVILPSQQSYGFSVKATGSPVLRTTLTVLEGARTRFPVQVTEIKTAPIEQTES
jgi:hypothetical protein